MNIMKKSIGIVLTLCILLSCNAALGEAFSFRNEIGWGMDAAAVRAQEGREAEGLYTWNGYTVFTVADATVSRYTAPLTYFFNESGLCAAFYDFGGELFTDVTCRERLTTALERVYGMPDSADRERIGNVLGALAGSLYQQENFDHISLWTTAEDTTLVAILQYTDDAFMILYANEDIFTESIISTEGL